MKFKEKMSLEDALIDLYLNVKVRKQDEIENMDTDAVKEEKENLRKLNPLRIIEYIKTSVDILIDVKVEERVENLVGQGKDSVDRINEYEPLLKKLESDIRQHIRMEHQLKLHSESVQSRVDELEKENLELHKRNKVLNDNLNQFKTHESKDKKDLEISQQKSEINNMKHIIKSYEDQSIKMSELEKKMKNLNARHEKDIKNLEDKYQDKLRVFSKKILKYEEITKTSSLFRTTKKDDEEEEKHNIQQSSNHEFYSHNEIPKPKIKPTHSKSPVYNDRKKEGLSLKDRIEQYKKLIDKNLQDISQSNTGSNRTKSGLLEVSNDRTNSNQSLHTREKSEVSSIKSHKRNESHFKNLDNATKSILSKEKLTKHNRNCSMEVKQSSENKIFEKSTVSGSSKSIHAMKEILLNSKMTKIPKPLHQRQNSINNPSSNIILNQGGNPCINQITIYTSNNPNTNQLKPAELNLRNILNKANKTRNNSKSAVGHARNGSKNNL